MWCDVMKEFKLIAILCFFLILFVGAGCVSAADNITVGNNDFGSYGEDNAISHLDDVRLDKPASLSNGKNVGSFNDLRNDISGLKDGDTFNLTKDYSYGHGFKYSIEDNDVIKITKNNITINGNGHIIKNVKISKEIYYSGLFGYNQGTISKLGIENISINISGTKYIGWVVGYTKEEYPVEIDSCSKGS